MAELLITGPLTRESLAITSLKEAFPKLSKTGTCFSGVDSFRDIAEGVTIGAGVKVANIVAVEEGLLTIGFFGVFASAFLSAGFTGGVNIRAAVLSEGLFLTLAVLLAATVFGALFAVETLFLTGSFAGTDFFIGAFPGAIFFGETFVNWALATGCFLTTFLMYAAFVVIFREGAFVTALFALVAFLTTISFKATFLGATFLAEVFFETAFLGTSFVVIAFFLATFLGELFLAAIFLETIFFKVIFFAAVLFAGAFFLAATFLIFMRRTSNN